MITRGATVALTLTGLSAEAARFQARSALTGTGYTTSETEKVVDHPLRGGIGMVLMLLRSAGFVSILISLLLSFIEGEADSVDRLPRLAWLVPSGASTELRPGLSVDNPAGGRYI